MSLLTAAQIAERLAQIAPEVAAYLLPNGKLQAGEWCVGDLAGGTGESLKVRVAGSKAGVWSDFAEGVGGDLLDLWAQTRGLSIIEAMREAGDYLGVAAPGITSRPPPTVRPPQGASKASADESVWQWLTQTRKLPDASLTAYRVAAHKGAAMFSAFTPDGKAIQYLKFRSITEKKFWSEKGSEPCLFGWQAIPPDAREVVICEGEMDCVAWHAYGYPALSVTNGAGNLSWIDAEFDNLARFDVINLSFDMDEPGQAALPKIAERLGLTRCRVVRLPRKDANECLIAGIPGDEIYDSVKAAGTFDPKELVAASALADGVIRLAYPDGEIPGVHLPWEKANGSFLFRPGELTILAGRNNTGKSQMAGQLTLEAMRQGERACVASMEFSPERLLLRMAIQAAALRQPSEEFIRAIHRWYESKLWVMNATGTAKASRVIDVFGYAAARYGVRWFVIDNLAKCGFGEDDYNGQKGFVDKLGDFARDTNSHVILIHHLRKGDDDHRMPTNSDIKGSGGIGDMADNVLLMWRNRKKEEAIRIADESGGPKDANEFATITAQPDAFLIVDKARNGDESPTLRLWYSRECYRYVEGSGGKAWPYVDWSAR